MKELRFAVVNVTVIVKCQDVIAAYLISEKFGALLGRQGSGPQLRYTIRLNGRREFEIQSKNGLVVAENESDFLFCFEKDMVVEVEKIRGDLYFLHAASLRYCDSSCLLVAQSGFGKSTTAWALCHHGFDFLSDEIAPIDLSKKVVHPFPQALCLKEKPPPPYPVAEGYLKRGSRLHIPVELLPCATVEHPVPLKFLFFLTQYQDGTEEPQVREVSKAEAAARLYANTLNALAHDEMGIDAAISISSSCKSYEVTVADLQQTSLLLRELVIHASG